MHKATTTARAAIRRLARNELPLGTIRLVLTFLTTVFFITGGALCVKVWTTHHHVQKHLDANLPPGVSSAALHYSDVRTTSILVFVTNNLVIFVVSHIFLAMLQDVFEIIPASVLRRFGTEPPAQPLTSGTLWYQVVGMSVTMVFYVAATAVHTAFVFSRSGSVVIVSALGAAEAEAAVQGVLDKLGIELSYRDTRYIRISAQMAWPALVLALLANVVTVVAWWRYRRRVSVVEKAEPESGARVI